MEITIKKIEFDRDKDGAVPFTTQNKDLLIKYIIPVITHNEGWGTSELDSEQFLKNPEKWRYDIDATVETEPNVQVHVALDIDDNPLGILVYDVESFGNLSERDYSVGLHGMIDLAEHEYWQALLRYDFLDIVTLQKHHAGLKDYIHSKYLYRFVAIVVHPDIQGKSSGVSESLYSLLVDGFVFSWTSSPSVLRKRRRVFKSTLFFPLFSQNINSLEELASLTVIAARLYARYPEVLKNYDFGVRYHDNFIIRDEKEYLKIAESFLRKNKITSIDYERFKYILSKPQVAGAIISVS